MAQMTLEELRRQEAQDRAEVQAAKRVLSAATARLAITQMRIKDHQEYRPYVPPSPAVGQSDVALGNKVRRLLGEDFNL